MHSRKLLTLVCVAAILAFGGCIFIPSGKEPAPPPLVPQGIENIQVVAMSTSEPRHIDPSDLAQEVTESINLRARNTGIKAEVQKGAAAGSAVLKVTILSETATLFPTQLVASTQRWRFDVRISATLTTPDGKVAWSETDINYSFVRGFPQKEISDIWQELLHNGWLQA